MEDRILKAISESSIYTLEQIMYTHLILDKSFDKLLAAINGSVSLGYDLYQFADVMRTGLNAKVKLTFWQKIKKCWKILTQ